MERALREAERAYELGEVPVGAVAVLEGRLVGSAHNQVETLRDATAHAEMLCLSAASMALGKWRLSGVTLYSTLEPCSMCAGALLLSRVSRVVYGAPDRRHGAHGSFVDLFALPHPTHTLAIEGGVLAARSQELMVSFFQKRRKKEKDECSCRTPFIG